MARALQAARYVAAALLGVSLLLLGGGLAMVARPDAFAALALPNAGRTGLEVALVASFGAITSAVLGRILDLLLGNLSDET